MGFTIKRGKAGNRGSSSLISLTEGTRPLSRYSLKSKPVGNIIENLSSRTWHIQEERAEEANASSSTGILFKKQKHTFFGVYFIVY